MESLMKITFTKRRYTSFGGAERYMDTLVTALAAKGHEVHIFCERWKASEDVVVHPLPMPKVISLLSGIVFNRLVNKSLREFEADCNVTFERTTGSDIYRAADGCYAHWLDRRRMCEGRLKSLTVRWNPKYLLMVKSEQQVLRETPFIIVNSKMVRDELVRRYGIDPAVIRLIYNGVDLVRFSPVSGEKRRAIRDMLGLDRERPVLLYVGSGFMRKGLETAIRALGLVDPRAVLLVAGKDRHERRYRRLAQDLGVAERIRFLGPYADVESLYRAADVFVFPTRYDPFSNATLEAMASGLPVVTTRFNGVHEILESGREGWIVDDPFSPEETATGITAILSARTEFGKAARRKAERYSINLVAEKVAALIEEAAAKRSDLQRKPLPKKPALAAGIFSP